jgi:hypothetical protein
MTSARRIFLPRFRRRPELLPITLLAPTTIPSQAPRAQMIMRAPIGDIVGVLEAWEDFQRRAT